MKKTSKKSAKKAVSPWWKKLEALGACDGAMQWAKRFPSLLAAWRACGRADWMLWLLGRASGGAAWSDERKPVVRLACAIARTALQYVEAGENRPRIAIETAEAWCDGKATNEQVQEARASACIISTLASSAASYAAAAAHAFVADDVFSATARSAAYAAAYVEPSVTTEEWLAIVANSLKNQCAIVRRHFPEPPKLVTP